MAAAFFVPKSPVGVRSVALLLSLLSLLAGPSLCRAGDGYERWYTLEMAGRRAGYMHAAQTRTGDTITSSTKIVLGIGRGNEGVRVSMEGTFVETAAGKPVSMASVQRLGTMPVSTRYTFAETGVLVENDQAGQVTRTQKPLPEGMWLTPAAAGEFVRQRLRAGAQEIVVRTVDPMSGLDPATITRSEIRPEVVTVMGRNVEGFRCKAVSSASPAVESLEVLDSEGIPIRSSAAMGGIRIKITAATKEEALREAEAPEMMVRTFVKPDRPIARPRETREAVFVLGLPEGESPTLPTTGSQRVAPEPDGSVRVTITVGAHHGASPADLENPSFREASSLLNSDDAAVRALADEGLRHAGEAPMERAEQLRRFVHEHISQKDLGVGFASASEVARSKQGDCTEHATLLAAMLRSSGIPSRVASGLIYADQFAGEREIFGYHMWAQALLEVEGKHAWVDLDATLPGSRFDATHITLAVSALPDADATASLSGLIPLLGRLEIQVESVKP